MGGVEGGGKRPQCSVVLSTLQREPPHPHKALADLQTPSAGHTEAGGLAALKIRSQRWAHRRLGP